MQLVWSSSFSRELKRLVRRNPQLRQPIEQTLEQLSTDPFHPSLQTHKLKGDLAEKWACSIDYSNRIVFRFVENSDSGEEEILLLALGSHDEVY
ncbi:type II toxin-antitoxin system mRNA interferase toxin, RelE/StbE family [Leptolyngbya sp. NK1-12]|uniref:Type II toxin-antitoxin system mRNA interferase toxin, RelE/StbE family n=1 Tax=Leptolyngbya sp. NK1-12 TaxID=2547451 RepID=A0AA96WEL5_9CYAN|nr:type II toxin-antitoxin system mRNA interferase toxin, RelE/StbE family [Leptolyngbya sp. NK1-12]WNZ23150.1 type II toxin-antitoxin system mRNA interferase toxin, RelE/StbE family [Leptolyngbya sp. NK1-12]